MKIIGHRGARGLAPENTIASFKKALEHHVDMLEFDLRVIKDQVVILHHDPEITDPNGQKLKISDFRFADLKAHKKDLCSFEEFLDEIGHPVTLYTEIKPGEPLDQIVKIIEARLKSGWKPEYFRLASFNQKILIEMHKMFPDITIIVIEKWSGVRATRRARQLSTKHIVMNQRWLWWGFIRQMTKSGYKLGTYTLNEPKKARRWERYGLRAVVTDYPDRFEKK